MCGGAAGCVSCVCVVAVQASGWGEAHVCCGHMFEVGWWVDEKFIMLLGMCTTCVQCERAESRSRTRSIHCVSCGWCDCGLCVNLLPCMQGLHYCDVHCTTAVLHRTQLVYVRTGQAPIVL